MDVQCEHCVRYSHVGRRAAFPRGIPQELFCGSHGHTTAYPGDRGLQFVQTEISKRFKAMLIDMATWDFYRQHPEELKAMPEAGMREIEATPHEGPVDPAQVAGIERLLPPLQDWAKDDDCP